MSRTCDTIKDYYGSTIYYSEYDGHCPHCCHSSTTKVGEVTLDNAGKRDVTKCNSCNAVFSINPDWAKSFIDATKQHTGASSVSYTSIDSTRTTDGTITNIAGMDDLKYAAEITNTEVRSMRQELFNLHQTIERLVFSIEEIAKDNQELKRDPLLGIKNSIYDFNLK